VLKYSKYALAIILTILLGFLPSSVSSQGEVTCVYDTGSDCSQWWDIVWIYVDGSLDQFVINAGGWSDPYTLESVIVDGVAPCQHFPPVMIYEPEHCLKKRTDTCPKKPRYYMFTLLDENQPPEWQRYCYVISNNGIPSVESQARVCSVPGYDHVYKATNIPYGGWVYTDCQGNPSYGWPDWQSSWYRPKYAR
jgi:predicted nucleic acid-binding Zn finger protein